MADIQNLSLEELQHLIDQRIAKRLGFLLGFEVEEETLFQDDEPDTRTWEQVKQDIARDRWTPPASAKSSLELLREDRER
jgi:hypothetical protein